MRSSLTKIAAVIVFIAYLTAFNYGGCGGGGGESSDSGSSASTSYRTPVLNAIGNKIITEGTTLTFTVSATDPDGDTMTFTAYNLPAGATFNVATQVFTWVPTYNQSGTYSTVRFKVADAIGLYVEETITITVTDVPAPTAPFNLVATVASATQINLSWQDNSSDETGFKVEQKMGGGAYAQIASLSANAITYSDTGLMSGFIYYYRVRAYSASGNSAYCSEVSAATSALNIAPTVMTNYLSNVSHNTASFYGNLNPNGLATTVYFEYGTTTSYGTTTASQSAGNGTTSTSTSADITGLTPSTIYHFRMVATNSSGTSYGTDQTFNTSAQPVPPSATTGSATNVTYNSVTLTGTANPNGFAATAYFQWGTTTAYGSTTQPIDIGSGLSSVNVADALIGIFASTTYHFRMVANNDSGTVFGNDQTFVTPAGPPTALTNPATDIDFSSAELNGTVNPNGLSTDIQFQWGATTGYGSSTTLRNIGSGTAYININEPITGLATNATYNFRLMAINASGTVYGSNQSFTAVTNTRWTHIAGGEFHTMGVKNDGTLWAWGDNSKGELGLGNYVTKTSPTQVFTDTDWTKVAVGAGFSLGLKADGTIWSCGDNAEGQLGLGIVVTGTNVFTRIGMATNWTDIAAGGHSHSFAKTADNNAYAWGDNLCGQLGLGDDVFRYDPTRVISDSSVASIACGYESAQVVKTNGTLWACGDNSDGELGLGDTVSRTSLTQVGSDTNWAEAESGYNHTVARKTNGTIWAWGDNAEGELGLGDTADRTAPAQVLTDTDWTDISVGYKHTMAKRTDGTIWEWGDNSQGQLGLGDLITRTGPTRVATDTDWSIVEAGWKHSIGIKNDDSLISWGDNNNGQLGTGDTNDKISPTQSVSSGENGGKVACGGNHTLAIKIDNSLWGWGYNGYGELGLSDNSSRSLPAKVGIDANWRQVSGGEEQTLAIKIDGTLWSCGSNPYGQLGLGDNTSRNSLTRVGTDTNWKQVSGGGWHTLAIKADGTLWAWGQNASGQLGLGNSINRNFPIQVGTDTNWKDVACAWQHTLAIKVDGTLWAWGSNNYGQLGLGDNTGRNSPVRVGTDTNWKQVSGGEYHTLAIKTDGTLWAWGSNNYGQLGLGDNTNRNSPVRVGTDINWKQVSGGTNTLAVKTDSSLWAWGSNNCGQLGLGDNTNRNSPVRVGTDIDWKDVFSGGLRSLAVKYNNTLWGWGMNTYYELGLGDTINRSTPTQIGQ
ncbi:MAG: fibronectin type III domain-containing protein [Candidatus Brocadiia bacterium]